MNIIVNLNKGSHISSHEAVTAVKKIFKVKKAGHAGTLDPLATGMLLVCLNEATKITGYLSDLDKEYLFTLRLGETTDTYDSEGKIIRKVDSFELAAAEISGVINRFIGDIEQTPPIYSAIKVNGSPLYKLARQGIEVKIQPRKVFIHSIDMIDYESPLLTLKVSCSKGTYVRSLGNDIGNALGVGAHIIDLKRTRIGDFMIENSAKIDELPGKSESLHSIDYALKHLPEVRLYDSELQRIKNGNPIREDVLISNTVRDTGMPKFLRLKDPDGKIFGIGRISGGWIKPERLFNFCL